MPATSEAALKRKRVRSRERKRENTRQWKLKNPEKVREQKTRYGQRNKKKVARGKRKWLQANEKKVKVQKARYKRRCRDRSRVEKLGKAYELKELWVVLTDCRKSTQRVKEKLPPTPPRKRRRGEKSKIYDYNWYEKLRGDPVRYKEYLERKGERVQRLKKDPVRYKQYREKRNAAQRKRRQKIREDPVLYKEHLEKIRESKQRLKNDPVRYKQHLERDKIAQRKSMQRIREDPLRWEDYRKRTIEYEQRRRAKKRKMNRKSKEVVETPVKSCDCGLCIPCKGFETLSWSHHYDHHFIKHKENDDDEAEERGYGTEDSDTSVDSALERELEHMLAQPSDAESDHESDEEPLVDELDHLLAYASDHEADNVMPRHIDRVRANHRWGIDQIVKQWQENEETERIVHELEEELDDLNTAPHEVSRAYHQFDREDRVEQSRSDYDRSIEVTQELMDELEQFLLN